MAVLYWRRRYNLSDSFDKELDMKRISQYTVFFHRDNSFVW
jgi:hypothetical protein